jgi:hypothetical protein
LLLLLVVVLLVVLRAVLPGGPVLCGLRSVRAGSTRTADVDPHRPHRLFLFLLVAAAVVCVLGLLWLWWSFCFVVLVCSRVDGNE